MLEKGIRKLIPSVAMLSRSSLFLPFSIANDLTLGRFFRSISGRKLPPLRYLVRTGVGNNIVAPHLYYLTAATNFWLYVFANRIASLESTIVDIGCGSGKTAVTLRDFDYMGTRFTGKYHGYDVDAEMVRWCSDNFPDDRFTFRHVDSHSSVYNPRNAQGAPVRLENCADHSVDLVLSHSLFSHLLEPDVRLYVQESARILRPGGVMMMTFFCLDDLRDLGLLGERWTFAHRRGPSHVENPRFPEAAVAYEKEWMLSACRDAGFRRVEVRLPMFQSTLYCTR